MGKHIQFSYLMSLKRALTSGWKKGSTLNTNTHRHTPAAQISAIYAEYLHI